MTGTFENATPGSGAADLKGTTTVDLPYSGAGQDARFKGHAGR